MFVLCRPRSLLVLTVAVYAGIGFICRTSNEVEYFVAGRRVPAMYNGLATAADWMSAASFIGTAGVLYLQGFAGLAYILGWTGGYCLVALLLAPYLRRLGYFTVPEFLGARYGGVLPRVVGVLAVVLVSFVYVVVQIYGVGLITSHLTGFSFEIGIFVGLGGVLVCSFLGGMRAVTWTQVAQYIVLIVAYLLPVVWLSVKQTGVPIPQAIYGAQLQKVTEREAQLTPKPGTKINIIPGFDGFCVGNNRELKRLMLGHAFTFAHTALFSVAESNLRSRRAMEPLTESRMTKLSASRW